MLFWRRRFYLWKAAINKQPIDTLLLNLWRSKFNKRLDWKNIRYLVIDTETTGLTPKENTMLSIGWVAIESGKVKLNSARHRYIKVKEGVGQSATIHQIRDCELQDGITINQAMAELLTAVKDSVLVFHHAPMDMAFLNKYSRQLYNAPLLMPVIDTLNIEKSRHMHNDQARKNGFFRLAQCRQRYGLSAHQGHNALTDAIATAELLLAQAAHKGHKLKVADLMH